MDMAFAVCAYTDRLLIEVIIMNNYLLITHGFNEFQIQEIVRKMADVRDAKKYPDLNEIEVRAKLHYAIEYMTGSNSDKIGHIGDLFPIYKALADRIEPTYRHNERKEERKNSKQMEFTFVGAENEKV